MHLYLPRYLINQRTCFISSDWNYLTSNRRHDKVPLLPGFTVVSGPNGSGKSNILDACCLPLVFPVLSMRAERLPDLVNHNQTPRGSTLEASVTVTLILTDEPITPSHGENGTGDSEQQNPQWSVTRKLRVTHQGTYTSIITSMV